MASEGAYHHLVWSGKLPVCFELNPLDRLTLNMSADPEPLFVFTLLSFPTYSNSAPDMFACAMSIHGHARTRREGPARNPG